MSEQHNLWLVNFLRGHAPTLVSAHAYEREGINAIPENFAVEISKALGWPHDLGVAQVNVVAHTGADGFSRLARQAEFAGVVQAAVCLTGKPHSAKLAVSPERLQELRKKHGTELEKWWIGEFAHAFDALTESEARYLARTETTDITRNRIAAAK